MRVQYTALLLPNIVSQLKRHLPEPPSDAEMRIELEGIERLEEALAELKQGETHEM